MFIIWNDICMNKRKRIIANVHRKVIEIICLVFAQFAFVNVNFSLAKQDVQWGLQIMCSKPFKSLLWSFCYLIRFILFPWIFGSVLVECISMCQIVELQCLRQTLLWFSTQCIKEKFQSKRVNVMLFYFCALIDHTQQVVKDRNILEIFVSLVTNDILS